LDSSAGIGSTRIVIQNPSGILFVIKSCLGWVHFNVSHSIADFSVWQVRESQMLNEHAVVVPALNQVPWFVELAPITSPAPELRTTSIRQRVLFDESQIRWPLRASAHALPFDEGSVPALMVRYAWQAHHMPLSLSECFRVLKPGGWWIGVSANPWHIKTWQVAGQKAVRLPSWPQLLWSHQALNLSLEGSGMPWRAWGCGFSPILVVVARKPSAVAPIRQTMRRDFRVQPLPGVVAQCEAA
jgi:hypothetical protein